MLHRHYPQARFVHMHPDGPDCALSMSRHPTFRRQVITAGAAHAVGLPPSAGLRRVAVDETALSLRNELAIGRFCSAAAESQVK
jgi:hypothetical protein